MSLPAREAARAVLTQLEYAREAAVAPDALLDLPLPAYLQPPAGGGALPPMALMERVYAGGGPQNDVLGALSGGALDVAAHAAAAAMPSDRIATTVLWRAAAEGETSEARRQRALHKQTQVLQGMFDGKE